MRSSLLLRASPIAVLALAAMALAGVWTAQVVFDSTPTPLPPNVPSLGFQATQTLEFGDLVQLAGTTQREVTHVTVTMSDWAKHSDYPSMSAAGWTHPITLNLYHVDRTGADPAVGALIKSVTTTFTIPWRPEADPADAYGRWLASDGEHYNGLAFNIKFDLSGLGVVLPDEVIYGVAYNTNTWGYNPINLPGPYESLNVGLLDASPSTGTDVESDAVFWNTMTAFWYADGGAGGTGTFRRDTAWSPYTPAVLFEAGDVRVGPPRTKDECKNDGWRRFNYPRTFSSQGDAIQFVNTGK